MAITRVQTPGRQLSPVFVLFISITSILLIPIQNFFVLIRSQPRQTNAALAHSKTRAKNNLN